MTIEELRRELELHPDDADAWTALMRALLRTGELAADLDVWRGYVRALRDGGRLAEAIDPAAQLVVAAAQDESPGLQLSEVLGDLFAAVDATRAASRLNIGEERWRGRSAAVLEEVLGRLEEAGVTELRVREVRKRLLAALLDLGHEDEARALIDGEVPASAHGHIVVGHRPSVDLLVDVLRAQGRPASVQRDVYEEHLLGLVAEGRWQEAAELVLSEVFRLGRSHRSDLRAALARVLCVVGRLDLACLLMRIRLDVRPRELPRHRRAQAPWSEELEHDLAVLDPVRLERAFPRDDHGTPMGGTHRLLATYANGCSLVLATPGRPVVGLSDRLMGDRTNEERLLLRYGRMFTGYAEQLPRESWTVRQPWRLLRSGDSLPMMSDDAFEQLARRCGLQTRYLAVTRRRDASE